MGIDHLMLNTKSMTYLQLPKRGEWCNELWKIWEFLRIFNNIKIINEDNPNFDIILDNPDWGDFGVALLDAQTMDEMVDVVQELSSGLHTARKHCRGVRRRQNR